MIPCQVCSVCKESGHSAMNCTQLYTEIHEPAPPQPSGPRGQDEDD
jgi:hypothetical protein